MSDYQQRKARALEIQREKDLALKAELEAKAAKDKQRLKDEEEKRKQRDAAAREARRLELIRANEALTKKKDAEAVNGDDGDWNPFVEVERLPTAPSIAALLPKAKKTGRTTKVISNPTPGPSSRAGPSKPRGERKPKEDSPPLSRKEKAAKLFAQKAKKSSAADSIFSVRALVESRDGPGSSTSSPKSKSLPSSHVGSLRVKNGFGNVNGLGRNGGNGNTGGGVKSRMNAIAKDGGMRKLCPDRSTRDRRTIDEIHNDIKSRRPPTDTDPPDKGQAGSARKPKPAIPTTARPSKSALSTSAQPKSRRRSSSSSEESPPRKRRAMDEYEEVEEDEDGDLPSQALISAEIQALFRRPGRPPPPTRQYSESEGSSDMEAGLDDVEMEERRTAAIARREDELAEREERERKLAKERLKKGKK